MRCPYCESDGHQSAWGVVRHVLMCHVPSQHRLDRVLFRDEPRVTPETEATVRAKCACGDTVSSGQLTFNAVLARHLAECGSFPELKDVLSA